MKAFNLAGKLRGEMRQSPVKTGLLALGVVVAGAVWVPRLTAALGQPDAPSHGGGGERESSAEDDDAIDLGDRDSLAMKAEFIQISDEARSLRSFAERLDATLPERDPFEPPPEPEPIAVEPQREEPPPDAPPPPDPAGSERTAAAALELRGVLLFPRTRRAVIGSRVLTVGDRVDGFVIEAISEREVRLRGPHGAHALTMRDPLTKPAESGKTGDPDAKNEQNEKDEEDEP